MIEELQLVPRETEQLPGTRDSAGTVLIETRRRRNFALGPGVWRRAGWWQGRAIQHRHGAKGPLGSVTAGVRFAALLIGLPSPRFGPLMPVCTAAPEQRCFNEAGSWSKAAGFF